MTVLVSVVVAVFNPGRHIAPLLDSLPRQTMPADQFEVIFVDDGSIDGTPERLDAIAAEWPNARVIRIPASGGPGRPRNLGIDAARGEYVQIVDNDDALYPRALERLYAYAVENSSDVVVGREVRNQRAAVGRLFERNIPNATLGVDPLTSLMTPHKMFRRQFLVDNGIRFFEGRRRLEDHPFVIEAFIKAKVISVLSDYACYHWTIRDDRSNSGLRPLDWPAWYTNLADAIRVAETHINDLDLRDRVLAVWYGNKVLEKLGAGFGKRDAHDQRKQWAGARDITAAHFPPSVAEHVGGINTLRDWLLRNDEFDLARSVGTSELGLHVKHEIDSLELDDDRLRMTVSAWFCYADDTPVRCDVRDGRAFYRSPVPLPGVSEDALDFTRAVDRLRLRIAVRRKGRWVPQNLPGELHSLPPEADGSRRLGVRFAVVIDPETAHGGQPLRRGTWELDVSLVGCGWSGTVPLRTAPTGRRTALLDAVLTKRLTVPVATKSGRVNLDVDQSTRASGIAFGRAELTGNKLTVPLRAVRGRPGAKIKARMVLRSESSGERKTLPAIVRIGRQGTARVTATVPVGRRLRPATWRLSLRIGRDRMPLPATLRTGPWRTALRHESGSAVG
jgi:poly(ribitol-phosphate) beta-N-acetylglucosaminyltransferase